MTHPGNLCPRLGQPRLLPIVLLLLVVVGTGASPARIAAQPPTPSPNAAPQGYQGTLENVVEAIDLYWGATFEAAGLPYASPGVTALTGPIDTGCGPADPSGSPAFYCPADQGIYFAPSFFVEVQDTFGDFAWVTILAHEWGHHVQSALGVERPPGPAFELQADCLAGAFAHDAERRGGLNPGDVTEAAIGSAAAGDPEWLPQDDPGRHGTPDERIKAYMRGNLDGVTGCALPIAPGRDTGEPAPDPRPAPTTGTNLAALLPAEVDLPAGLFLVDEGGRGFDAIAASFPDPTGATDRLALWGFRENAYRNFATPDGALSVQISLHRFAAAEGAAAALPYYADGRVVILGLRQIPDSLLGDQSATIGGEISGGEETTVYVRRGAVLARVSAVSTEGDPTAVAERAAAATLDRMDGRATESPDLFALLPTLTDTPVGWTPVLEGG